MHAKFFLMGMEKQWDKMVEEYCWVITHTVGWYFFGLSSPVVLEFGFQLDPLVHNYTVDHMYAHLWLALDLLACNYCKCYRVSVWWQNSWIEHLLSRLHCIISLLILFQFLVKTFTYVFSFYHATFLNNFFKIYDYVR